MMNTHEETLLSLYSVEAEMWCCPDDSGEFPTWERFLLNVASDAERFGSDMATKAYFELWALLPSA